MELKDAFKNVLLAGVGAAAITVEKSSEVIDTLVKKGELTVEQGKAMNQELKHKAEEAKEKAESANEKKDLDEIVAGLSDEDKEKLKALLADEEKKDE